MPRSLVAQAGQLDHWHWRNPAPFGTQLRSICFGAGKFVAVGNGGVIQISSDGSVWDSGTRPVTNPLYKVIYANGQFVAVGGQGVILTSVDGLSWSQRRSGCTNAFFYVTYGNGRYFACGQAGQVATSADGSNWEPGTVGTADYAWAAAGNGVFILPGGENFVQRSSDGITWGSAFLPAGGVPMQPNINQVGFGNGLFVASARTLTGFPAELRFITSSNGTNWTRAGLVADNYLLSEAFLTFLNGKCFALVGSDFVVTTDGNSVTSSGAPTSDALDLAFGNGRYVLLGNNGMSWTSTSGTNWTPGFGGSRTFVHQVVRGTSGYLAVSGGSILESENGLDFDVVFSSTQSALAALAFDGTNYVAVGESGTLYTSTGGVNWTQRTSNANQNLQAICRGSARWVAVGDGGTVITSPTTATWTLRASGTVNHLRGVTFGGDLYVAVGDGGTIITSPDGAVWDVQDSGTTDSLYDVKFLQGWFYAIGAQGTILASSDAVTWMPRISGVALPLTSITVGNGSFVVAGTDFRDAPNPPYTDYLPPSSVLLTSTNGIDWNNITTNVPAGVALVSAAFLDGSFWLTGDAGTILQSDTLDGVPLLAGSILPDNSGFLLRIVLNDPAQCQIQSTSDLLSSWNDLTLLPDPVVPHVWTDTTTLPTRYYRVKRLDAP